MIVFFFILAGLLSQMKLKVSLLILSARSGGIGSTDVLQIILDKPRDLTILILPIKVRFRRLHAFRTSSMFWIFTSKEKCTPRACTDPFGHLKLYGVSRQFLQEPTHKASVLEVLISNPQFVLNSSKSFNNWVTDSRLRTKTVVSSAYCVILISFWPTFIPWIVLAFFKALAKSSIPITNRRPDNGQPCLTPRYRGKNSDAWPLFITQLETW